MVHLKKKYVFCAFDCFMKIYYGPLRILHAKYELCMDSVIRIHFTIQQFLKINDFHDSWTHWFVFPFKTTLWEGTPVTVY